MADRDSGGRRGHHPATDGDHADRITSALDADHGIPSVFDTHIAPAVAGAVERTAGP